MSVVAPLGNPEEDVLHRIAIDIPQRQGGRRDAWAEGTPRPRSVFDRSFKSTNNSFIIFFTVSFTADQLSFYVFSEDFKVVPTV